MGKNQSAQEPSAEQEDSQGAGGDQNEGDLRPAIGEQRSEQHSQSYRDQENHGALRPDA